MPKTYRHATIINLPREALFAVMTDINNWPKWDLDLVAATHDGAPLRPGSGFSITPKGNKPVAMSVEAIEAPGLFVDQAKLPLGCIRGVHRLEAMPEGTRLIHEVSTSGPLAWLWDRVITRDIGAGLAEQAARLGAYAAQIYTPRPEG